MRRIKPLHVILAASVAGMLTVILMMVALVGNFTLFATAKADTGTVPNSPTTACEDGSTVDPTFYHNEGNLRRPADLGSQIKNSNKDTKANIGKDLDEALSRGCSDPSLLSTEKAGISKQSKLTHEIKLTAASMNAQTKRYVDDRSEWARDNEMVTSWLQKATVTRYEIPAGWFSLCEKKDGDSVRIYQCKLATSARGLKFTYKGDTVVFSLDCGFQYSQPNEIPNVPVIPNKPHKPTTPSKPTPHVTPKPHTTPTPTPDCKYGPVDDKGLCPKSKNPKDGYKDNGGKPNVSANPTADATAPVVATSQTNSTGVVDSSTNTPGSESGGNAPGAVAPTPQPSPAATIANNGNTTVDDGGQF